MATTKTQMILGPAQELLFKLIGLKTLLTGAQSTFHAHKARFQKVYRYTHAELNGLDTVYEMLFAFDKKHNKLPESWAQFTEFVQGEEKNELPLSVIQELRKVNVEDLTLHFTDLEMNLVTVIEHAETERLSHITNTARQIATGGRTIKEKKYSGAEDARRYLLEKLGTTTEDQGTLEEGEIELIRGVDGAQQFTITAIPAASVKPEPITWLWPDRIPMGKMSLYTGKPDCGKSTAVIDLTARVSAGKDFPDGAKNTLGPREVLMAVAEDDLADTVVPRLMAAGADLTKIHFIHKLRVQDFSEEESVPEVRQLQLAADVKKLKKAIEERPEVALVICDTITSFFGDVNTNADQDIRPVMDALAAAFRDVKACFLAVIHHNKRSDADAVQKILGAASVAGAVRAAWGFSRDPENDEEFIMARVKGNLSQKKTGLKYRIEEAEVGGVKAPHIVWGSECEETANEVMDKEKEASSNRRENKHVSIAKAIIIEKLKNGSCPARDIFSAGEAEGISAKVMRRAKAEMKVQHIQKRDGWYWFQEHPTVDAVMPENIVEEVM